MADALPGHISDVQQTVDATQVNKRTVVGEVLDDTFDILAFLQRRQQLFALVAVLFFQHCTAGNHHVVALLVELDDLEFQRLAFQVRGFAQRANVDQRTRQERTDFGDVDGETTLHLAVDDAGDHVVFVVGCFQLLPAFCTAGFFAGQTGFTETVVDHFHGNLDLVADAQGKFTLLIYKLTLRNHAFGLQSGVYNDPIVVDINHRAGNDRPRGHLDGA